MKEKDVCAKGRGKKEDGQAFRSLAVPVFRKEKLHEYDQEDDNAESDRLIIMPDKKKEAYEDGSQQNGFDGRAKIYVHLFRREKRICPVNRSGAFPLFRRRGEL
jgi:hypothetical protein